MTEKTSTISMVDNLELHKKGNYVLVSVNPKIYPLDVVHSAAYVLMDRAYIIIGGDPKEEIIVELRPKDKKTDIETLGRDFNNELLNYAVYLMQSERNRAERTAIIQRALQTTAAAGEGPAVKGGEGGKPEFIDDPEGIAKPWKEQVGEDRQDKKEGPSFVDDPLGIAKPWKSPEEADKGDK
jgi:His-Xaa-Ser system protein HxsD